MLLPLQYCNSYCAALRRANIFWVDYKFFCRDFMHIVLVHYLEVKVIPNPTLIDIYLAACPLWLLDFIILNAVFLKKIMLIRFLHQVIVCCLL